MAKLKGVILGVENVLLKTGDLRPHHSTIEETGRLVRFLKSRNVETVVFTNRSWFAEKDNKPNMPLQDALREMWGVDLTYFQCGQNGVPAKQTDDSIKYVRDQRGWQANETLFIGNTEVDMQCAVNGKVLLLNAQWYQETMPYGFPCETPKEVARFIDTFCFRDEFWYFKIEDGPLQVYSLAPLSSFVPEDKYYTQHFIDNVKKEVADDEDFWAKLLSTSTYFDGVYDAVNYITAYPKHEAGRYQEVLVRPMTKFAHCFRTRYIPDLVTRHTTALKSQSNRATVTHSTQLDSIHLKSRPNRITGDGSLRPYVKFPIKRGSKVMLIDDVCTKGMSFEAARMYLNSVGATVVCVSFLKALKHSYESLKPASLSKGPFNPNLKTDVILGKIYPFRNHIADPDAPAKLSERLRKYENWDWPAGI